jgi:hypothetical protein
VKRRSEIERSACVATRLQRDTLRVTCGWVVPSATSRDGSPRGEGGSSKARSGDPRRAPVGTRSASRGDRRGSHALRRRALTKTVSDVSLARPRLPVHGSRGRGTSYCSCFRRLTGTSRCHSPGLRRPADFIQWRSRLLPRSVSLRVIMAVPPGNTSATASPSAALHASSLGHVNWARSALG